MTEKEIAQDLLNRIPDNTTLEDIALHLEFIAAMRKGRFELYSGDSVPIEELEEELRSWTIKI